MIKELHVLKNNLLSSNIKGIALDIDETLSATLPYWFKLMQENFGNPENLTVKEMIKKYRYYKYVPYWQSPEAWQLATQLRDSNESQLDLEVLKEADKYVQRLIEIIPVVVYITARPDAVIPSTIEWLRKNNFPNAPVIAKPKYIQTDQANIWKAEVLEFLHPQVIGIIDDNPEILNFIDKGYQGHLYLYDNNPKEIQNEKDRVYICPDWESVIDQVKKQF